MKLSMLTIHPNYLKLDGTFVGEVQFSGDNGTVQLKFGPELAKKVLAIVADEMVAESRKIAANLTSEIFESRQKALTAITEG